MILAAVFLLSFSSLAFEVLLTRVFSISQWNHLSFMVISIALFGFAASGTFLSIAESKQLRWHRYISSKIPVALLVAGYSSCTIFSFVILNRLPLDYFRMPLELSQSLYLLIAYLLLSMPFFFTGLTVCAAYAFLPEKTGSVYLSTMMGAAFGAFAPLPFLTVFGIERSIFISAMIPLILLPFTADGRLKKWLLSLTISILAVAVILFTVSMDTRVKPSPYKSLSQILRFPNTGITETITTLRGRMDKVKSPYIRFAPGMSLKFTENLPRQHSIFKDGDAPLILYDIRSQSDLDFARFTLPYSGYILNPQPDSTLLLINGGGISIPCALAGKSKRIVVVEQHPYAAAKIQSQYNLTVYATNPRSFISNSKEEFSVIHIEDWGPSLPGTAALNQSHLFTRQALKDYIEHLEPAGVIILSRKLLLPPADSIRLWATAYEALKSSGSKVPDEHMAVMRNWDTFTLLISKTPIRHIEKIRAFARNLNFDLIYLPDLTKKETNQYNEFDEPFHFNEISRLRKSYESRDVKQFFQTYLLDVSPQSDNRPFPSRFLKWTKILDQYKSMGSRFYSLFLSGEVIVCVVFFEALLITTLLLLVPVLGILKRAEKPSPYSVLFFLGVGFGFMFIELYFIKAFTLLFGDPVISLTVVLSGILIFSGAGGFCAKYIDYKNFGISLIALLTILLISFHGLQLLLKHLVGQPAVIRYVTAFLILSPFGFLMGIPFPLGMQFLLSNPAQRAYGWAVNGCASVLTSILSVQIALSFGISYIMICAIAAYGLVYFSYRRVQFIGIGA